MSQLYQYSQVTSVVQRQETDNYSQQHNIIEQISWDYIVYVFFQASQTPLYRLCRLTWELHMSISSQTGVTPTELHLRVNTWNFFLLSPLEAGSLWIQITLFGEKKDKSTD